jgi:putative transposase
MGNKSPKGNLPRLERYHYQGHAVVMWTITLEDRSPGWLTPRFHADFRELLLHSAAREQVWSPAYCLMPDHSHLVWMGLRRESDQLNALRFLRRQMAPVLAPWRLQHQAYDHVLREEERKRGALASACFYILANPVRAGLVERIEDWPFSGSIVPGYPDLHPTQEHFWETFWKLYVTERNREATAPSNPPLANAR